MDFVFKRSRKNLIIPSNFDKLLFVFHFIYKVFDLVSLLIQRKRKEKRQMRNVQVSNFNRSPMDCFLEATIKETSYRNFFYTFFTQF